MNRRATLRLLAATPLLLPLAACSPDALPQRRRVLYAGAFSLPNSIDEQLWFQFRDRIEGQLPDFDVRLLIRAETGPEEQTFASLRRGRIQVAGGSFAGVATLVPEIALLSAPFLFDSAEEVDWVMDRYMFDDFSRLFAAKGLTLLQWTEVGWVYLYGKEEVRSPEAARGRRIRASSSIASQAFIREIGADTITMPFSDVVPSLQTGLIEGGVTSATMYSLSGIASEAPNFVLTRHSYDMGVLIASSEWMETLSTREREVVSTAFGGAPEVRKQARASVERTMQDLAARGVKLIELSAAERERWREAAWPSHQRLIAQIGGQAQVIYDRLLQGKASFAATHGAPAADAAPGSPTDG